MDINITKAVQETLGDKDAFEAFAKLNRLSPDATKLLLERMLKEPEISKATQAYIDSPERSDDFKAFNAGEEKGYSRGQEAGFAKGATVGGLSAIGLLTLAGLAFLKMRS